MNELITIDAILIAEAPHGLRFDCEGDKAWFPKRHVTFDSKKNELKAPKWLLQREFPETKW